MSNEAAARHNPDAGFEAQKRLTHAWNDGYDFAIRARGWWSADQDPVTEGLYLVTDGVNFEVSVWYAKTDTRAGEWSQHLGEIGDPDKIVAWMMVPNYCGKEKNT